MLPNSTLEPGFPQKICLETTRTWLHQLGFEVLTTQNGIFVDGHKHSDVIDSRKLLRWQSSAFFTLPTLPPRRRGRMKLTTHRYRPPTIERRAKTAVLFHDESTFTSNEDQSIYRSFFARELILFVYVLLVFPLAALQVLCTLHCACALYVECA